MPIVSKPSYVLLNWFINMFVYLQIIVCLFSFCSFCWVKCWWNSLVHWGWLLLLYTLAVWVLLVLLISWHAEQRPNVLDRDQSQKLLGSEVQRAELLCWSAEHQRAQKARAFMSFNQWPSVYIQPFCKMIPVCFLFPSAWELRIGRQGFSINVLIQPPFKESPFWSHILHTIQCM